MKVSHTFTAALFLLAAGCSDSDPAPDSNSVRIEGERPNYGGIYSGFYILNRGNAGANKCTLDFYDYYSCTYSRDIYSRVNDGASLGDTGADMAIDKERLYIAVEGSDKVVVTHAASARHIGSVNISSPRCIALDDAGHAYIGSRNGSTGKGSVVRVDTSTLKITGSIDIDDMPEDIIADGTMLYVAAEQSGITAIDAESMTIAYRIDTDALLQHLLLDNMDALWGSSHADNNSHPGSLQRFARGTDGRFAPGEIIDIPVCGMTLGNRYVFYYAISYDSNWTATSSYGYFQPTGSGCITYSDSFITPAAAKAIEAPQAIEINKSNGDFIITDALDFTGAGKVHVLSAEGTLRWSVESGEIPNKIALLMK